MARAKKIREEGEPQQDRSDFTVVAMFALALTLAAFAWFSERGDILLYGDAVAHINIARRLTDARELGTFQLGTVWLPLPHLLIAPFVAIDGLWRSGVGGSIPSMVAYVLGVAGIFQLVRARASRAAAALAAGIYALNPSLLYMQATAMTESIFLAAVIWSVYYFDSYLRGLSSEPRGETSPLPSWRALERCALCLAAAIFTRYDGWILAFIVGMCAMWVAVRWLRRDPPRREARRLLRSLISALLLLALCPALWLAHNYEINRRPLDWLNGPYSARAIEKRTTQPGAPPYPGKQNVVVAAEYFLKAARMNTGEGWREYLLIVLAAAGVLTLLKHGRRYAAFILLLVPLPFYAWSIAYGSVPIFVPEWWPFSYYNVRYGLELLPAIAAFASLPLWVAEGLERPKLVPATAAALWLCVLVAYASSVMGSSPRAHQRQWERRWMIPICYREAYANSRSRLQLEKQLAAALGNLPSDATIMMYTSDYVGALQLAGIPLQHVTSESSGIFWEAALSAPFASADYVVAVAGDPVDEAVRSNPRGLTLLAVYHTFGKPAVRLYHSSRR
jgi:4-amino-4-deoxy-L-arabinose transferase-like glycosyltransferase